MANLDPGSPSTTLHEKHEAQTKFGKTHHPPLEPKWLRGDIKGSNKHNSSCKVPSQLDLVHFTISACHPYAGTMLINTVSFQSYQMIPEGNYHHNTSLTSGNLVGLKQCLVCLKIFLEGKLRKRSQIRNYLLHREYSYWRLREQPQGGCQSTSSPT